MEDQKYFIVNRFEFSVMRNRLSIGINPSYREEPCTLALKRGSVGLYIQRIVLVKGGQSLPTEAVF